MQSDCRRNAKPPDKGSTAQAIVNADLVQFDDRANPRPYLAEALPRLDTESWRVLPKARMDTVYVLRAGLMWHDGVPLSAQDFVFSWRVLMKPDFGFAGSLPVRAMEEVVAADDRTLHIRWSQPYPDADDVGRSHQLMLEVGFTRAGGFYARDGEGRFTPEVKTNAGVDNETEMTIMACAW